MGDEHGCTEARICPFRTGEDDVGDCVYGPPLTGDGGLQSSESLKLVKSSLPGVAATLLSFCTSVTSGQMSTGTI